MIQLKGITWNHPRGLAPLKATAAEYERSHPGVQIAWDVRSLKDFGDYPVELLCDKYDLIMLDHPFIGTAAEKRMVIPLDEWVPPGYRSDQAAGSVGPSYRSYTWGGHQWALAADVAGQVAGWRRDLLTDAGQAVPRSWSDVFRLAQDLPDGMRIGWPLIPTDAICSLISICANLNPAFWNGATGLDPSTVDEALALIQRALPLLHPKSLSCNPPQILDLMSHTDEVAYVPLLFGYSNYSRVGYAPHLVHFSDVPSHGEKPRGSLLGGVGLAISAASRHKEPAVDYAMYVASPECQCGLYYQSGGQPGHRTAWTDPRVNLDCGDFFSGTLQTLDLAFLRPRHPHYNPFQEQAGELVFDFLQRGGERAELTQALNRLYLSFAPRH